MLYNCITYNRADGFNSNRFHNIHSNKPIDSSEQKIVYLKMFGSWNGLNWIIKAWLIWNVTGPGRTGQNVQNAEVLE